MFVEACSVPGAPGQTKTGTQIDDVIANHKLLAQLMAHALACDQTRVFNMVFADALSNLRKAGSTVTMTINGGLLIGARTITAT